MLRKIYLLLLALSCSAMGMAQPLFTIDGKDVPASEFRRECRDYVEEADTFGLYSLMLDYADYRLLVHDAKTHSYDTTTQFRNAMQYYGNMLMLEHIAKNPRSKALITKIHQNSPYQYKVWAARVDIYANSGLDSLAAYHKATRLIERIGNVGSFEKAAIQMSDSPQTKYDGGYLGWVSPIDINVGEDALDYILNHYQDAKISRPIRSGDSYYVVKVDGRRDAIAEVNISPIIIRKQARNIVNDSLRQLMESISNDLKSGKKFDDLQLRYSEITYSEQLPLTEAYRKYSTHIADIKGIGQWSELIETPNYYLIARLNAQTPLNADNNYLKTVDARLWGTDIFHECYSQYLDSVRKASNYQKISKLDKICRLMPDSSIFEAKWEPNFNSTLEGDLMSFGGKTHSLLEFAEYIRTTQYNTGYTKITEYVSHRYNDYLDMLTQQAARQMVSGTDYYNQEIKHYTDLLYFEMHSPYRQFAANAKDTAKVYNYYKSSHLSLKTNHVLNIRFYDYYSEQNRKKAAKLAAELTLDPKYAYNPSILKSGDAGTFRKGDNTLADKIIDEYDNGHYGKVFFFSEQHTMAIVNIEQTPQELSVQEIFPRVAPIYFNSQKENYMTELRSKYNLTIKPEAPQVLATLF
ncbi:MAG: peptidylprolyl isomerase [Bacteroidales bacterium]|nr:peptidylprolyl isomerase [Bacteroidales bacterium]